jgi:hypothetical protein
MLKILAKLNMPRFLFVCFLFVMTVMGVQIQQQITTTVWDPSSERFGTKGFPDFMIMWILGPLAKINYKFTS